MAQYRQGKVDQARATLAQIGALTPELDGFQRAAYIWHDWLVVYTLRREVETLMTPAVAPPPHEVK